MTEPGDLSRGRGEERDDLLAEAPALIRLTAGAGLRTAIWGVRTGARTSLWGLRRAAALIREPELVDELARGLVHQARRALGVEEIAERVQRMPDPPPHVGDVKERINSDGNGHGGSAHASELKRIGSELLARSADLTSPDEPGHPAYERILTSMAPDEARILRLMAVEGPRAAVDVRTWRPLDVGSDLVAPGLTMIGQQAGCRFVERVPAYLNNLERLGLIWFSREPVDSLGDYQVLEAQPEVTDAMERAGRARTIRRSIRLTPFGMDFCEVCLPLDTGQFMALKARAQDGALDLK